MKIIKLYTGEDNLSHFTEFDCGQEIKHILGMYSKKYKVSGITFREFAAGAVYEWHNAPQPQYIIYLEGVVEVKASNGEIKQFKPGDVLLASDLIGKGHITRTLTKGKSIIVTTR